MEGLGHISIGVREYSLKLGNNDIKLSLTDGGIAWAGKGKAKDGSIEWSDILNVAPIPSGCRKPQGPGISLFYISRLKVEWKKAHIVFNTPDEAQATSLVGKIVQTFQEKAIHRPKRLLVIVNPKSGGCKGVKIYEKVSHLFELASIRTQVQVTERAGHAIDYLKEVDLSVFDGVVAVGGDGTFTECLSGLTQAAAAAESVDMNDPSVDLPYISMRLGLIPAGTGQGMIMLATGSKNLESSALHIIKGSSWNMDMFTVHNGPRLLTAACLLIGYGYFSQMIKKSESNRQLGRMRYLYAMLSEGIKPTPFNCDVEVLGSVENGNPPEVSCRNGPYDKDDSTQFQAYLKYRPEEWIRRSGEYINIGHFMLDYKTINDHNGHLYMGLTKKTSVLSMMKLMVHLRSRKPLEQMPDWFDFHYASCYKIKPFSGKTVSDETSRSSAGVASDNHQSLPFDCVNIDGDCHHLDANSPEIQIKLQAKRIRMFGTHPHAPQGGPEEAGAESEEGATGCSY